MENNPKETVNLEISSKDINPLSLAHDTLREDRLKEKNRKISESIKNNWKNRKKKDIEDGKVKQAKPKPPPLLSSEEKLLLSKEDQKLLMGKRRKVLITKRYNDWQKNLTEEEKQQHRDKVSLSSKRRWANLSSEDREKFSKKVSEKTKEWYNNLPIKRKEEVHKLQAVAIRNKIENMTEEEYKDYCEHKSNNLKDYWSSLSTEEREARNKHHSNMLNNRPEDLKKKLAEHMSKKTKEYFQNVSEEAKRARYEKAGDAQRRHWNSLTLEQKRQKFKNMRKNIKPNKAESFLSSMMDSNVVYTGDFDLWRETPSGNKNPDFVVSPFERTNKVIELWGNYFHAGQNPQDLIEDYAAIGVKCLVIWEAELMDPESLKFKLKEFLGTDAQLSLEPILTKYRKIRT